MSVQEPGAAPQPAAGNGGPPLLEVDDIHTFYGSIEALKGISISVREGSVHAFVGENGAGKSTLGKIIAGVFPQDQGDLVLRGATVSFGSPRRALLNGIALVAQEVALVPRLTVAQNVFLGTEPRRAGFIDRGAMRDRFQRLAADTGFDLQSDTMVGRLRVRGPDGIRDMPAAWIYTLAGGKVVRAEGFKSVADAEAAFSGSQNGTTA